MKTILLCLLSLVIYNNISAQLIHLPPYQVGFHYNTEVYSFYGAPPFVDGKISLGFDGGFVTGVDFKMVVERTDNADTTAFVGTRDSSGIWVPIHKGDSYIISYYIPVAFKIYAGKIGFRVIVEGIPRVANEGYYCNLGYGYYLNTWHMDIHPESGYRCFVISSSSSINEYNQLERTTIYPNPFIQSTTIKFNNKTADLYTFIMYDALGNKVKVIPNINKDELIVERDNLASGIYFFSLSSNSVVVTNGKLIIE